MITMSFQNPIIPEETLAAVVDATGDMGKEKIRAFIKNCYGVESISRLSEEQGLMLLTNLGWTTQNMDKTEIKNTDGMFLVDDMASPGGNIKVYSKMTGVTYHTVPSEPSCDCLEFRSKHRCEHLRAARDAGFYFREI